MATTYATARLQGLKAARAIGHTFPKMFRALYDGGMTNNCLVCGHNLTISKDKKTGQWKADGMALLAYIGCRERYVPDMDSGCCDPDED